MTDAAHPDDRFSRIEQIYHQALEQSEEDRPAFLAQACAGDNSLRREVEKLLSFDKKAGSFMESPALDVAAQALARKAEPGKRIDLVGQTILHYKVLEKIGEGGMGIVYRAFDTHLQRPLAIKVLPPEIVADRERRRRFVQEARAASALNHPNIVHVYDIDQTEGADFIAMEYVSGKTLGELIPRKGMRLNDALKYSVQIADALAAAHAAGIVHRDLKPANVMVTERGLVKVLDFGLAKLTESADRDESGTTETLEPRTEEGTILGTVAYMSPEQAEGKKVDARSDIFSLGSVLYEMVTGQKAFQGTSKMSTLSAILHQEPKPVSGIMPAIPADLEKLINRCLRKDPAKRFQYMADVKVALDELNEDSDSGRLQAAPAAAKQVTSKRLVIGAVVAVALFAVTVAGWYWIMRQRSAEPEAPLTAVPLTSYPGRESCPSFSADGNSVAFQWCTEGPAANCDIYIKQIGQEPPFRLTSDPAKDCSPAWSPDGRSIAFLRKLSTEDWSLLIVPPLGGQERVLVESGVSVWDYGPNLAWTPDSKWLAFPWAEPGKAGPGLFLLSVQTLEKRRLTSGKDASPAFPPDGRALVFTRWHADASDIYLLHLGVDYAPKGAAIRVAAGEPYVLSAAWTSDGREIVSSISSYSRGSIWRMEASPSAKPRRLPLPSEGVGSLALSRQGDRLAYTVPRNRSSIWRIDLSGSSQPPGTTSPLIQSTRSEGMPAYSQDGRKIAFTSERSGQTEIWVCDSDGSNAVQLTSSLGGETFGPKWSPDGRNIAFVVETRGHGEVYILSSKGGSPRRLTSNPTDTTPWPCWSGDGQSIYFRSTRGGTSEIWKMPAAGGDAVQITPNGDERDLPQESPDGKYLYYVKADRYPEQCSVWRMPSGGGEENRVLESTSCGGPFAVVERGIYFITPSRSDISYYDFSSGSTRKVVTAKRAAFIEASPDGRTILYTQVDEVGSDLMLVENFR